MVHEYYQKLFYKTKAVHDGCLEDDFGDSGLSASQVHHHPHGISIIILHIDKKIILLFVKSYLADFDKSHARAQVESLGRLVAGLHLLDTKVSHNCLHWCILMII